MYREVPPQVDLPAAERETLAFWREQRIFERSTAASVGRPLWMFYEGPPTTNGVPGTHHVEARVFKDLFPRYRTMKGYHVPRKAGWDCHGLPVELAVERELGFTGGKASIEEYGIAAFNAKCREEVLRNVDAFEAMTERMGYWVDTGAAYRTMDPDYIESVWWSLKTIFDKGLLVQDHRVAPYCPRCGTSLSDHELAQGYETVVDPSVYVRFPITSGPLAELGAALVVWTTTPWTLVSNTAVAVNPAVTYAVARTSDDEVLVVAEPLLQQVLGEGVTVLRTLQGTELERTTYRRPFDLVEIPDSHFVALADYVTVEDGSGLVHQAPAFGADDLNVARAYGLPVVNPLRPDGHFEESVPLVGGMFFKKADDTLVNDLRERGLLLRHEPFEHSYPHCWRCHTPLMYYAQPSWYIRTTAIRDQLLRENESTNWFPETIKWGRYGDWLTNNVDWALSRNRYWGTPLPIWRCANDHLVCVGSLAELGTLARADLTALDPHRPYVDDVTFACAECSEPMTRVPEVIDCWYDSGSMPFAQWGYPHRNVAEFESTYPADFICEAIDQTRGWFYTLMAVGTLVFDRSSYRNVLCLGHILDEQGRKMSKHLGNVLEPIGLMDEHGADAVRWFMLAGGSPWGARRVGHSTIQEAVRKTLLTYWATASFLSLYGRTAAFDPAHNDASPAGQRPAMDRWALSQAHRLVREVDDALEGFDTQRAGRLLAEYVDDLSNWYVRRSRRRFWNGDADALATLHECLRLTTLALAPFTPFVTERVWSDIFAATDESGPESVHLASWPEVDDALIDDDLAASMAVVRRAADLGRTARATSGVKNRQPLAELSVLGSEWVNVPADLRQELLDELNVQREVTIDQAEQVVTLTVKPNFRALGRTWGKRTQRVADAINATEPRKIVDAVRSGAAAFSLDGDEVTLAEADIIISEEPTEGWVVAQANGLTVALDLALDDDLRKQGIARDAIRLIQDARKRSGLDVSDRIELTWGVDSTHADSHLVVAALREHRDLIGAEVLATSITEGDFGALPGSPNDLGVGFMLTRDASGSPPSAKTSLASS